VAKPDYDACRIKPGQKVRLSQWPTDDDGGRDKDQTEAEFDALSRRLGELQELLYAEGKHALLVVLQATDTGGKDSTIRKVFAPVNPQGCSVVSFKAPTGLELRHDFLWRVHAQAPARGMIVIFNRSHYEDVLVVRVKDLVPEKRWRARYEHINSFERLLRDEGTTILKFFLHVSKDYQKQRLQQRLDRPDKWWKFEPADLTERQRWDEYQAAYDDMLSRCSTEYAPWYVIPAEKRWYRNWLISSVLVDTLEGLNMSYPKATFDPKSIVIR